MLHFVIFNVAQKNRDELHTFIRHGYPEGVCPLVSADPTLVIGKSEQGRHALHIAVLFANLEIINTLIDANPKSVNTPDNVCARKCSETKMTWPLHRWDGRLFTTRWPAVWSRILAEFWSVEAPTERCGTWSVTESPATSLHKLTCLFLLENAHTKLLFRV